MSSAVLGRRAVLNRPRRDAPTTTWVPFTDRANSRTAVATSSPTTVWKVPPRSSVSCRSRATSSGRAPMVPSPRTTCTATSARPALRPEIRDPRRQQRLALGPAGQRDDDAGPRRPRVVDAVLGAVALQPLLDPVGEPQQGELAQRGEVADPEVVAEGRVDLLGLVDVAVGQSTAQRLRAHVDELDLVGRAHDGVGDGLALLDPGDRLDHVVQRLEVLDVDGGDDVDARVEELVDVLPPLGVARARDVGVRQLVDEATCGCRARTASRSISSKRAPR